MEIKFIGSSDGYGGPISAEISLKESKLLSISLKGESETPGIGGVALSQLENEMISQQTWDVDAISGATITSSGARYAVRNALISAGVVEKTDKLSKLTCDVVIVGCGVSGISAGLALAERGLDVIMVERSNVFGGNGMHAHGGFFVETYLQKEAGETYTVKDAYEESMYYNNYLCDPLIMRRHLGEGAETVRWLNKDHNAGLILPHVHKAASQVGEPFNYHAWAEDRSIWPRFKQELLDRGVRILFETKGSELIQGQGGKICGVVAEKSDGEKLQINSKAVYIATGGYLRDDAMLERALGSEIAKYLIKDTAVYSDGSGLRMAWSVGAGRQDDNMISNHGGRSGLGGKEGLLGIDLLMYIPILWVNKDGHRFMDEGIIPHALFFSNLLISQKGRAFIVFDQKSIDQWKTKKIPLKMAFWDRFSDDFYCPPVSTFEQDFLEAQKVGQGFKAESIAELAEMTGMIPSELEKTILSYNEYIATGIDLEFGKEKESLLFPVSEGPFYAIMCRLQAQCTVGGIKIDDCMRALNENEEVIPGLYAGGADAGGMYNGAYSVQAGTAISWALTSGRLAGISIAEDLSKIDY